jgi:hypothetical protein
MLLKPRATKEELAQYLNISVQTLLRWFWRYPELKACVDYIEMDHNGKLIKSLYKRAEGYEVEEQAVTFSEGKVSYTVKSRHIPGDANAGRELLRRAGFWGDKEDNNEDLKDYFGEEVEVD